MADLSTLKPGTRVFDRHRNRERLIHAVEPLGRVVKIWFKDPHTGALEPMTFPISEVERRFEVVESGTSAFRADSETVRLLAESYRLQHAYLFNSVFATETSLIDPLPHQLIAVYDYMLKQPRLRFLLADDAGAGKTIMAGLTIREMLLRRLINRVLIVPPAGLVGNWEKELRNLFRLRFHILESADAQRDKYWLYVVFNCETKPELKRIADPAGKGIGRPKGGVTIDANDLVNLPGECD